MLFRFYDFPHPKNPCKQAFSGALICWVLVPDGIYKKIAVIHRDFCLVRLPGLVVTSYAHGNLLNANRPLSLACSSSQKSLQASIFGSPKHFWVLVPVYLFLKTAIYFAVRLVRLPGLEPRITVP